MLFIRTLKISNGWVGMICWNRQRDHVEFVIKKTKQNMLSSIQQWHGLSIENLVFFHQFVILKSLNIFKIVRHHFRIKKKVFKCRINQRRTLANITTEIFLRRFILENIFVKAMMLCFTKWCCKKKRDYKFINLRKDKTFIDDCIVNAVSYFDYCLSGIELERNFHLPFVVSVFVLFSILRITGVTLLLFIFKR